VDMILQPACRTRRGEIRAKTGSLVHLLVAASGLVVFSLSPCHLSADDAPVPKQEYYRPFKGHPDNVPGWEPIGPDSERCVHFEAGGLHLALPQGHGGVRPSTGVSAAITVKGDFEITMSFEIVKEPEQAEAGTGNTGTRLSLGITKDTPKLNQATISRAMGPQSGRVFVMWTSLWTDGADKATPLGAVFATEAKTGRLRLVRSGSDLSYYASEGADGDFNLLKVFPFGKEDLREVRIIGSTGGGQALLDALVADLRIRADAIPNMPTVPAPGTSPPKTAAKGWLAAGLLVGLLFVLSIALGVWFIRRQRNSPAMRRP
jgi:hypothetical protein